MVAVWTRSRTGPTAPSGSQMRETIGRITTSGQITEFPVTPARLRRRLRGIVTGPDGALWFTSTAGAIGRITTTGQVTQYPLPNGANDPDQITVGPDGRSGLLTQSDGRDRPDHNLGADHHVQSKSFRRLPKGS